MSENTSIFISEIKAIYSEKRLVPFIGAGFSKPLGLPSWKELIDEIALELGFRKELFYLHGTLQQLAEYLKITNRKKYDEFKMKMYKEFETTEIVERRKSSITHKALANLDLNLIYTTNYDSHIEGCLMDNCKNPVIKASLDDFIDKKNSGNCEVIKFHGTLNQTDSIVLTESEYFERMSLDSPVDQKLRADILSNSFLFMGYSFQDPNIRYIWYKLYSLLLAKGKYQKKLRPSYFVSFGAGHVQPSLLEQWNINVIELDPSNILESLAEFLNKIKE
ncbi:MAG: SIR2 family protein [Ignavibacteriae bacterium]|nr:SIR2 family protein [Ignavibacteriota bacterium]